MTKRIGIYGGLFDPVHRGHVAVANTAAEELQLDEMHIVPCHLPNHKQTTHCSPEHRLKMLELSTQAYPVLRVNPMELEKDRISYSVETLEAFRAQNPSATLVFVLGSDAFVNLTAWHRWQDMLSLCQFYILSRPGSETPTHFTGEPVRRIAEGAPELLAAREPGRFWLTTTLALDVSSSKLREELLLLARGEGGEGLATQGDSYLAEWTDPKVLNYIMTNELYAQT